MKHRTWNMKHGGLDFDADKGTNGGVPENNGNPPAGEGEGEGDKKPDPSQEGGDKPEEKKFTQKEIDGIIAERLAREKKNQEAAAEKARKQAEEDALVKNQEFQKLSDERGKRVVELENQVAELTTVREQADRYKAALEKYLVAEKQDLPKHVLTLLEKLDPVDQIEYIAANRAELGKPQEQLKGVPPSPDPKERKLSDEQKAEARKGQALLYNRF